MRDVNTGFCVWQGLSLHGSRGPPRGHERMREWPFLNRDSRSELFIKSFVQSCYGQTCGGLFSVWLEK